MMACPEDEMAVEDQSRQLLAEVTTFEVSGSAMSMSDAEGTPVLRFSQS